ESSSGSVGESSQAFGTFPFPTSGGTGSGLATIGDDSNANTEWHIKQKCNVGIDEPGTITLLKGRLRVDDVLEVGPHGSVTGNGTLSAGSRVINGGLISPGLSPGAITIEGNYEQIPE